MLGEVLALIHDIFGWRKMTNLVLGQTRKYFMEFHGSLL